MSTKPTQSSGEAFDRFRELTKRIVSTPKAKVDALAKELKAKKRALKPAG
jgi:hypothetical protein